jgi:hypothetical protein
MIFKTFCLGFFLHSPSDASDVQSYLFGLEMAFVDFEILNLILILFKLFVSFSLIVQMRKDFIVNSKFERLPLLNDIQRVSI